MASHKTENLELNSWERTDLFNMDEFNENFSKLDLAVGENSGKIDQGLTDTNSKIDQGLTSANSKIDQGLTETNSKIDQGLADANSKITKAVSDTNTALAAKADKTALQTLETRVTTVQGTIPKVAIGTYTGTGNTTSTTVTVGFKPKVVLVAKKNSSLDNTFTGLILENQPLTSGTAIVAQITANGFTVSHLASASSLLNGNFAYVYLAIG